MIIQQYQHQSSSSSSSSSSTAKQHPSLVLLGQPRPRPPVGLSVWTSFVQPSQCSVDAERVGGCGDVSQIVKLHPLQEILWADSVIGGDVTHPANHRMAIVLQAEQFKYGCGPGFTCMEHGATGARFLTLLLEVVGNKREKTGRSSSNMSCATLSGVSGEVSERYLHQNVTHGPERVLAQSHAKLTTICWSTSANSLPVDCSFPTTPTTILSSVHSIWCCGNPCLERGDESNHG